MITTSTVAVAHMNARHDELLRQAAERRLVASTRAPRVRRSHRKPVAVAYHVSTRPFVAFQGWLSHGYL